MLQHISQAFSTGIFRHFPWSRKLRDNLITWLERNMSSWTYFTAPVKLLTNANGGKNGGKFRRRLAVVVFLLSERRGQNKKLTGSWVDLCLKDFREMATQFRLCLLKRVSENGNVTWEVIFLATPSSSIIFIFFPPSPTLPHLRFYIVKCIRTFVLTRSSVLRI